MRIKLYNMSTWCIIFIHIYWYVEFSSRWDNSKCNTYSGFQMPGRLLTNLKTLLIYYVFMLVSHNKSRYCVNHQKYLTLVLINNLTSEKCTDGIAPDKVEGITGPFTLELNNLSHWVIRTQLCIKQICIKQVHFWH